MFEFFCYALQAILSLAQNDIYRNYTLQAACLLCANAPRSICIEFFQKIQKIVNFLQIFEFSP